MPIFMVNKQEYDKFRRAVAKAGSIASLAKIIDVGEATLYRYKNIDYKGSFSIRAKIETFLEMKK